MGLHLHRMPKIGPGLRETGTRFTDRTPTTPIRQGRNTPGGMVAVFVLIGFIVVAIALFT
jgi:hypothetical protein